eukprot:1812412-Prymnesium_polylepis.1
MTPAGMYWLFEFEMGLRFVREGGRKGTLRMASPARQIHVQTSSGEAGAAVADMDPPAFLPLPQPREAAGYRPARALHELPNPVAVPINMGAADGATNAELHSEMEETITGKGGRLDEMLRCLAAADGERAVKEQLKSLGFDKLGERLRLVAVLRRLVEGERGLRPG